jgi:SAM-dependent methyltransferase
MSSGPMHAHVEEAWLSTLEVNAAFDRPWVDAATAWLVATRPVTRVVDVGCGAGGAACSFAAALRHAAAMVVGLDRDPRLLDQARRRASGLGVERRVRWVCGGVDDLAVRARSVDVVWASGVVHHIADQQGAIDGAVRLLRPGGRLALVEGGLPMRCLPHDVGIGRPGLEARLDEARARWFEDLRAELGGPPLPYGWPAALRRAGLLDVRSRSYIAEATAPLDDTGRRIVLQHLTSARDELGDRLDAEDRATVARLLDPDDPLSAHARDDLTVAAVRTLHTGRAG